MLFRSPLNAVGTGAYPGFPDILTTSEVEGPTAGGAEDGALFRSDGTPAYCFVAMHNHGDPTAEYMRELRGWLTDGVETHAFLQCLAAQKFENNAIGHFLTSTGVIDDGPSSAPFTNHIPDVPFSQYDGSINSPGGFLQSLGLAVGSSFLAGDELFINDADFPTSRKLMWMSGFADGNPGQGRVSYLVGHNFNPKFPVSANPSRTGTNSRRRITGRLPGFASPSGTAPVTSTNCIPR